MYTNKIHLFSKIILIYKRKLRKIYNNYTTHHKFFYFLFFEKPTTTSTTPDANLCMSGLIQDKQIISTKDV